MERKYKVKDIPAAADILLQYFEAYKNHPCLIVSKAILELNGTGYLPGWPSLKRFKTFHERLGEYESQYILTLLGLAEIVYYMSFKKPYDLKDIHIRNMLCSPKDIEYLLKWLLWLCLFYEMSDETAPFAAEKDKNYYLLYAYDMAKSLKRLYIGLNIL